MTGRRTGWDLPLLVNLQPAGEYLGEDYYRAGGVPAVVAELMRQGLIHESALTVNGSTLGENCRHANILDTAGDPAVRAAAEAAGRLHGPARQPVRFGDHEDERDFRGLPRSAICRNPDDPEAFEGRAVVFDGPEDYHARIDDPALGIDEHTLLFMRGTGPIGYPGAAEVVNMRPPAALIKAGIHHLPCIGDGRQSGTSGSPSILERLAGSGCRRRAWRCCEPAIACASICGAARRTF